MVNQVYTPDKGDLVWLDFDPQAGREQSGRRPGLVLSPRGYNQTTSLAIVCPITSRVKGYPFEVALPPDGRISGAILVDHLKSLDWKQRNAEKAGSISLPLLALVHEKITALLGLS